MIRLSNLEKAYGRKVLFNDVSYHFPEGERIALVGPNGVGKTTLINIICGLEESDRGDIKYPKDCKLGYLPQEPCQDPAETILQECLKARQDLLDAQAKMQVLLEEYSENHNEDILHEYERLEQVFRNHDGYELESNAAKILMGLGYSLEQLEMHPKTLSGGWQMRLELAKLFLKNPDILILDEPTNHLDLPSMVWVEKYLNGFKGTLIFISHDRELLNRLSTKTLLLNNGQLWEFAGNYDKAYAQWMLMNEQSQSRAENLGKKTAQLQKFVDTFGAKASKAKQAKSKEKNIAKLKEEQAALSYITKSRGMRFKFEDAPKSERIILDVKEASFGYEDKIKNTANTLINDLSFNLENNQRIAVLGANGIGKSTFLKSLAREINLLAGNIEFSRRAKLAYFAQDQLDIFSPGISVLQNLINETDIGERQARAILGGFLFSGDDVKKEFEVLSGGEKNRVGLARVVSLNPNIMMLDEPSNHLDMESTEQLVDTLKTYKGALILVSHNRYLIENLCSQALIIKKDSHSFERIHRHMDFDKLFENNNLDIKAKKDKKENKKSKNKKNNNSKNNSNQISKLEKEISKLQAEIKEYDKIMGNQKTAYNDLYAASDAKEKVQAKLNKIEEQWLELSEDQ